MESEGVMGSSGLRNTNSIRHKAWDEAAFQVEVQKLHGHASVDAAGDGTKARLLPWEISRTVENGVRSLVETRFAVRSQQKAVPEVGLEQLGKAEPREVRVNEDYWK